MKEKETRLKTRIILRHADTEEWNALDKNVKKEKLDKNKKEETPCVNKE